MLKDVVRLDLSGIEPDTLDSFICEYAKFLREIPAMSGFFFRGGDLHIVDASVSVQIMVISTLAPFKAGWIAGSQSTVENIMRDGL